MKLLFLFCSATQNTIVTRAQFICCSAEEHPREDCVIMHMKVETVNLRERERERVLALNVAHQETRSCCNCHPSGTTWSTLPDTGNYCGKKQVCTNKSFFIDLIL
jgi:hypothetical protein